MPDAPVMVRHTHLERFIVATRTEGQERIYVAGEPEAESEQRRRKDGIPLAPVLVAQCDQFARDLGVAPLVR